MFYVLSIYFKDFFFLLIWIFQVKPREYSIPLAIYVLLYEEYVNK